jgi:hypothetical protein
MHILTTVVCQNWGISTFFEQSTINKHSTKNEHTTSNVPTSASHIPLAVIHQQFRNNNIY